MKKTTMSISDEEAEWIEEKSKDDLIEVLLLVKDVLHPLGSYWMVIDEVFNKSGSGGQSEWSDPINPGKTGRSLPRN